MMKKIMTMLLAAAMPATAAWCEVGTIFYADVQTDNGATVTMGFTVTSVDEGNKTCQVGFNNGSAISTSTSGGLTIPAEVEGYTVTAIDDKAFYFCTSLTSVVIPDGVTSIGTSAFQSCYSLTSIDIPDGVMSIGDEAFYTCRSLSLIEIPESVTSIGEGAFKGCIALQSVNIPDGVTSIEANTFFGCRSLTSIDIPDGVTSIGASAFEGCTSLTSIKVPGSVKSVGYGAFYCSYVEYIDMSKAEDVKFYDAAGEPTTERIKMGLLESLLFLPASMSDITGENVVHVDENGNAVCDNLGIYEYCVFGTPRPFTADTVTCDRRFSPSDENAYTLCLPYGLAVPEGMTAFTLSGEDGDGSLVFTETEGPLEAYKPYLVTVSGEVPLYLSATGVQVAATPDEPLAVEAGGYRLCGTTREVSNAKAAEMGAYILQPGTTWKPVSTENPEGCVMPGRAYLVPTADASNAKEIKSVFANDATGIETLKTVSRDGTTRVYDLNGRRINGGTGRGIYIVNGKKYSPTCPPRRGGTER